MKTKIFKRITAAMLAAAMAVTSVSASAENSETASIEFKEANYEYIENTLPEILFALECDCINDCRVTNYFPIYTENGVESGQYISFVINENSIIGDFTFSVSENGERTGSAGLQSYPDIDTAFLNNERIALFCIDRQLVLKTQTTRNISNSVDFQDFEICIDLKYAEPRITYYNYRSGAPIEEPGENGTCWAACVASKVMSDEDKTGIYADTVYSKVMAKYGAIGSRRERYQRGLDVYDITMSTSFSGVKAFPTLKEKTESGNLVIMRLSDTGNENGSIHAVVLEGYLSAHANGGTYMLMDPNYEGYRGVSINAGVYSGNIGFTYSSAIGNYTWIDSICSA